MDLDQEICLCFHVSRRKLESFIRHEKPRVAAQLSECFGAGTGCGWCRRYLVMLFENSIDSNSAPIPEQLEEQENDVAIPDAGRYAEMRKQYRESQSAQPANDSDIDSDIQPDK